MKRQLCFSFVLSCEGVNPGLYHTDTNVRDVNRAATHAGIDTDYREGVDCVDKLEYREVWKESGFKRREMASCDASGILEARDFFRMLDDIGALFEDVETMGTLGGPLGGLVPDFAFTHESSLIILSMRATPCIKHEEEIKPVSDNAWQFWRRILSANDPWQPAHGNLARCLRDVADRAKRRAEWEAARLARQVGV